MHSTLWNIVVGALTLVLSFGFAPTARAELVTFSYGGTIAQVAALDPMSPFPDPVDFGTRFSGTFSFDSSAPNAILGDPAQGSYASPTGRFTLSLGGLDFAYDGLSIGIFDGPGFNFFSVIHAENPTSDSPTGVQLSLSLTGLTDAALNSNAQLLLPPSLSLFDTSNAFFFTVTVGGNQVEVGGSLESLNLVSEPPAPLLLVLMAAWWASRSRQRSLLRGRRTDSPH